MVARAGVVRRRAQGLGRQRFQPWLQLRLAYPTLPTMAHFEALLTGFQLVP